MGVVIENDNFMAIWKLLRLSVRWSQVESWQKRRYYGNEEGIRYAFAAIFVV